MDIGGTKTLSAVVDAQGRVLARHRIDTPQRGPADFVQVLAPALSTLPGLGRPAREGRGGMPSRGWRRRRCGIPVSRRFTSRNDSTNFSADDQLLFWAAMPSPGRS